MSAAGVLAVACDELLARRPPRAGSLVVTLFGDSISAHGDAVWLGSVIAALGGFGLNPRQIRTAVCRLGQEGWLSATQRGRRSYYRYTEFGQRQYARAAERIYAAAAPSWDGRWTLVTPLGLAPPQREALRRQLGWLGFGSLPGGLLALPGNEDAALAETLAELGIADAVVTWQARADASAALPRLATEAWRLAETAARFRDFCRDFARLLAAVDDGAVLEPALAFRVRTLLVHEYRRILLTSTDLPAALLPRDWPGHAARELACALYHRVHAAAAWHCEQSFATLDGRLPPPRAEYHQRFGGLPAVAPATASAA